MSSVTNQPKALNAHVTIDGNKIVVDRSEFPFAQYPAISNADVLRSAAVMLDARSLEVLAHVPRRCAECETVHSHADGCPIQVFIPSIPHR